MNHKSAEKGLINDSDGRHKTFEQVWRVKREKEEEKKRKREEATPWDEDEY